MADKQVTLQSIHDAINIGFTQIGIRLGRVEADTALIRDHQQTSATRIALLEQECTRRGKRTSELVERVRQAENTGTIHYVKVYTAWRTVAIVGAILAALLGLLFTGIKLFF